MPLRDARTHILLGALAACIVIAAGAGLATSASPAPAAARAAVRPTAPPAPKPPPLKLLFSRKGPDDNDPKHYKPTAMTVHQDGTHQKATKSPVVRPDQRSSSLRRIVYSKTIDSDSSIRQDCYVAGCPMRFSSSTEAGIAIAHLDGSRGRLLTKGGYDIDPRFSPDGRLIAYRSHRVPKDGYRDDAFDVVVLLDPTDGSEHFIDARDGYSNRGFAWSPDGRRIAVLRDKLETNVDHETEIVIINIHTGAERVLVKENLYDEQGDFHDLDWSHDGRHLVAVREDVWRPGEGGG